MIEPNSLRDAALRMLNAADAGMANTLWDGASAAMKKAVERAAFASTLAERRRAVGNVVERQWLAVARIKSKEKSGNDADEFANVTFQTSFADRRQQHELVTFRLDEDGVWRLAGYSLGSKTHG